MSPSNEVYIRSNRFVVTYLEPNFTDCFLLDGEESMECRTITTPPEIRSSKKDISVSKSKATTIAKPDSTSRSHYTGMRGSMGNTISKAVISAASLAETQSVKDEAKRSSHTKSRSRDNTP